MKTVKIDPNQLEILRSEIGKVRCWLTGFHAGRGDGIGNIAGVIPGEDSLRQVQILLRELTDAK